MLHRKFSSTTVRKNSLCHPASASWGKLTVIQGSRGRHTPTHSCRKSLRGADYSWQGGGRRAGRDPSSAFTEIMRSRFLKAHHKLSSIWEPLFLAGPTQEAADKSEAEVSWRCWSEFKKNGQICAPFPKLHTLTAHSMPFFPRKKNNN